MTATQYQHTAAIRGTLVHAPSFGVIETLHDRLIIYDRQSGTILAISSSACDEEADSLLAQFRVGATQIVTLTATQMLVPGLIDTHVHAPQYQYTGTATDLPLFEWLNTYAFPAEQRLRGEEVVSPADIRSSAADRAGAVQPADAVTAASAGSKDFAHSLVVGAAADVYGRLVRRLLSHGTTTAAYFATLDVEPTKALVNDLAAAGQRAVVGKVSMDQHAPLSYVETTEEGLKGSEAVADYVLAKGLSRLMPCVTPRFIPTCSTKMLAGLGELARHRGLRVQSHLAESIGEVAFVHQVQPDALNGTQVFAEAGLLRPGSVFAHGTMLADAEISVLATSGASIAHCPLSNLFFGDCLFRVKHAQKFGLKVGLGTDVAGGYSPSMMNAMGNAVLNSRAIRAGRIMHATDLQHPVCGSMGARQNVGSGSGSGDISGECVATAHNSNGTACVARNTLQAACINAMQGTQCNDAGTGLDGWGHSGSCSSNPNRQDDSIFACHAGGHASTPPPALSVKGQADKVELACSSNEGKCMCNVSAPGAVPAVRVNLEQANNIASSISGQPYESNAGGADVASAAGRTVDPSCRQHDWEVLSFKDAFYLATQGGADALGLGDTIGSFRVGCELDALLIETGGDAPTFDIFPSDTLMDRFEKWCHLGDDRNVLRVWVQGVQVHVR